MKVVTSLACAAPFAFGMTLAFAGLAFAGEGGCRSACADGYTWSSAAGACVPKTVSS